MFFYILLGLMFAVSLGVGVRESIKARFDTSHNEWKEFFSSTFAALLISTFLGCIVFVFGLMFCIQGEGEFEKNSSISYKLTDKPQLSNKTLTFHYLDGADVVQEVKVGVDKFTIENFDGKFIEIQEGRTSMPVFAPFSIKETKYAILK